MNAAPFSARLLTNAPLPAWHKATPQVREVAQGRRALRGEGERHRQARPAVFHRQPGHGDLHRRLGQPAATTREWAQWAAEPIDEQLLGEVLEILKPIHNWFYIEGRPENNDEPVPA